MSDTNVAQTIQRVLGTTAAGFGVAAVLAPGALTALYGLPALTPSARYIARLWGTTLTALGAVALLAKDEDSRRLSLVAAAAANTVDTVAVLTSSGLPTRTRVLAGSTTGSLAVAAAIALAEQS